MALELEDVNIEAELAKAEIPENTTQTDVSGDKTADVTAVTDVTEAAASSEEALAHEEHADDKPADKPEKKGDPTVALRIARKEAKELKEQLRMQQQQQAQQLAELQAKVQNLTNPPADKPTFETDPATYLKSEVDEIKSQTTKIAQANELAQVENRIKTVLENSESNFAKEHPDYSEAAGHLVRAMTRNMELLGVTDLAQRNTAIRQEIYRITATALKTGKEPAELVYELSQNLGYTGKQKAAAAAAGEKLEKISKGQEAASSLGSGSRSDAGKLTLDALARMDDDDFNALVLDEAKWKQIGALMH